VAERADAVDVAVRALRHRDLSAREVDERLARAGVDASARAETLETLRRVGYVDDARAALGRAEALAARGYGDDGIRIDLERRGFVADEVEAAVEALPREAERALAIVVRDGASGRVARRLTAKGFSADVVADVLGGDVAAGDAEAV
jgi:SOS response regulatory protein OraA/RecX